MKRIIPSKTLTTIMLAAVCCCSFSRGEKLQAIEAPFKKGDRVAFIGDSITAWGQYTAIIHLFCQTRYPDQKFSIYNNALAGDRALYTRLRADLSGDLLHRDILRNHPNVAVIMLGMNDAKNADIWSQAEDVKQQRRVKAAGEYRSSMDDLIAKLQAGGVGRIILILSCPYDETTAADRAVLKGKNGFIQEITGDYLRKKSKELGTPLIDFNTPMLAINAREQSKDPKFSLADMGDRVHPVAMGHFVMAYLFLKETGMKSKVAKMEIDAATAKAIAAENCEISNLRKTDSGIRFDCLARSLPFPSGTFDIKGVVPFDKELNRKMLHIRGLDPGAYALSIDGQQVSTYTAEELDCGVNLAVNQRTPEYQQALKVKQLSARSWLKGNSKRHLIGSLRLMHIRRLSTRKAQIEYMRSRKRPGRGIVQQREAEFTRLLEEDGLEEAIATSIREAEALNDQAYEASIPKTRRYELTRNEE